MHPRLQKSGACSNTRAPKASMRNMKKRASKKLILFILLCLFPEKKHTKFVYLK